MNGDRLRPKHTISQGQIDLLKVIYQDLKFKQIENGVIAETIRSLLRDNGVQLSDDTKDNANN
jgi:hypothetical protein